MWQEYFTFSKKEKNGIVILLTLIIIVLTAFLLLPLFNKRELTNHSEFVAQINNFKQTLILKDNEYYSDKQETYLKQRYDTLTLFKFDPNKTSINDWKLLGLSENQIRIIENFCNKGGHFYQKSDFAKIYGISQSQYQILEPYIDLPQETTNLYKQPNNYNHKNNIEDNFSPDSLFTFDPNTTSEEEWQMLGLSDKQITTLQNYISKGGRFYKPEDLEQIYGITENQYKILEPYIKIESINKQTRPNTTQNRDSVIVNINLNSATISELTNLPGIGSYFAEKIIKFREALGGFVHKNQILEVYGMRQETYEKIEAMIFVGGSNIKKLNINFLSLDELKEHPYLKYHQAKAITDFRDQNGPYQSVEDLLTHKILTQTAYLKVAPYLTIQ